MPPVPAADPRACARLLLEAEAVNFRAEPPFIFTSGLAAPVYVDCRRLISFPRVRAALMDGLVARLDATCGVQAFDAVAGGETAGIPFAAWIAERMGLPMLYVRKQPKGFGRNAQIEGTFPEGARVLLVEDLSTDGGSKLRFASALREAGAVVTDTAVVFHYGIFPDDAYVTAGLRLHALATWRDVLAEARAGEHPGRRFEAATLNAVEDFLAAPYAWSKAQGGWAGPEGAA